MRTGTTTLRAALRAVLGRGPVRTEGLPIEDPHLPNIFSALEDRGCRLVNGALAKADAGSARRQTTRRLRPQRQFAERGGMWGLPPLPCWSEPVTRGSTRVEGSRYPAATHARGGLPAYVASNSLASKGACCYSGGPARHPVASCGFATAAEPTHWTSIS